MKFVKGDEVTVLNYFGLLNPDTVWLVEEVKRDVVLLRVKNRDNGGLVGFTNQSWFEKKRLRHVDCNCMIPGQDDGHTTCWRHHDCMEGSCTHME